MSSLTENEYADAAFDGLDLANSDLRFRSFDTCVFRKCRFTSTHFIECDFRACRFEQCDLSLSTVRQCRFSGAEFVGCKLTGINWTEALLDPVGLFRPLAFDGCTLNYGTFIGLKLPKLRLTHCTAHDVDFSEADLTGASCRGTDFSASRFHNTNLTEADFTSARNYSINAATNKLHKTKFALPEAIALLRSLDIVLVDDEQTD